MQLVFKCLNVHKWKFGDILQRTLLLKLLSISSNSIASYFIHKVILGYLTTPYKIIVIKSNYDLLVIHMSLNKMIVGNSGFGTIQEELISVCCSFERNIKIMLKIAE